jgi:hypothetical protein
VACDLTLRLMFSGQMTADLISIPGFTELFPGVKNPTLNLGSKSGVKLYVPFNYKFSESWSIEFGPWYEYSAIGESNIVKLSNEYMQLYLKEPSSTTHQYGFNLSAKVNF